MKHGILFGENIKTEKIKRRKNFDQQRFAPKGYLLPLILIVSIGIIIFRLVYLQIIQGDYYRELSDSNRLRSQTIHAPRGVIFDRHGTPLVLNIPGFRYTIKNPDDTSSVKTISLNTDQALDLISKGDEGLAIDSLRSYVFNESFAHVLGYVGQITKEELGQDRYLNYTQNDWVGKTGVEKAYEDILKGKPGKKLIETDALSRKVRVLGQVDPIAGRDITLTLDAKLQEKAYVAAETIKKGAVIISRPNGEILTLISKPSFDPNIFTLNKAYANIADLPDGSIETVLSDIENQPLLNRAISGVYPPGSTFKMIVAAAGLENKIIDEFYSVIDTGILHVGEFSFSNWFYTQYGGLDTGGVNVVRGISRSNDIFFYKLAEKVGTEKIAEMAASFGVGRMSGIDLSGEAKGTLPSRAWKKEIIKDDWYLGDTYHFGIGQGFLLTTPLQVNVWTQVLANGGKLYKPRLLKTSKPEILTSDIISEKTNSIIRDGMIESCTPSGVAWPLYNFKVKNNNIKIDNKNFLRVTSATGSASLEELNSMREVVIACKTGTSEHGEGTSLPHASITLYAPAYDPEIVVTVLNESAGEGSAEAGPVAKKILEAYFSM